MTIFHINFEQGISVFRRGIDEIALLDLNLDSVSAEVGGFGPRHVRLGLLIFRMDVVQGD